MNTTAFWIAFICEIVRMLPYRLMAYLPFRKQLRLPTWAVALLIGITQIIEALACACRSMRGLSTRPVEIIAWVVCLLIFFVSVDAGRWRLLLLCILIIDYVMLVRGTSFYIEAHLFYSPDMTFNTVRSCAIATLVFAVTAPFMAYYLLGLKKKIYNIEAPALWRTIWLIPTITTIIVFVYTMDLSVETVRQFRFLISRFLLIVCSLASYSLLISSLKSIQNETILKEELIQQENLQAFQRTQYNQMSRHIEETRQARHDLVQHLRLIQNYLNTGNEEALKEYLQKYEQRLPVSAPRVWSSNYMVNTLISYYANEAEPSGIEFKVKIDIPEQLPISEPDFCSVLGNLLENALLSCRDCDADKPFIRVLAKGDVQQIVLGIDNTCTKEPVQKNGKFVSSRHEGFGLGTESVRHIAEQYHGQSKFTYKDQVFRASVILNATKSRL